MYRVMVGLIIAILSLTGAAAQGRAQDEDLEATNAALETQVSELETQVAPYVTPQATPATTDGTETGTAVAESNGIEILYYYFVEADPELDYYPERYPMVLGALRNPSSEPVELGFQAITFTLLDESGNVVDELYANPIVYEIGPRQVMPFDGYERSRRDVPISTDDWQSETLEVSLDDSETADPEVWDDFTVTDVAVISRTHNSIEAEGIVVNQMTEATMGTLFVYLAVYRSDGLYAGSTLSGIESDVPAGKGAHFTVRGDSEFPFVGLRTDPIPGAFTYEFFVGYYPGFE